jgi:hypothetical protein
MQNINYWNQPHQFLLLDREKLPYMLHYTIVCNCSPIEPFLSEILQYDTTLHGPHPLLWIKVISRADNIRMLKVSCRPMLCSYCKLAIDKNI